MVNSSRSDFLTSTNVKNLYKLMQGCVTDKSSFSSFVWYILMYIDSTETARIICTGHIVYRNICISVYYTYIYCLALFINVCIQRSNELDFSNTYSLNFWIYMYKHIHMYHFNKLYTQKEELYVQNWNM